MWLAVSLPAIKPRHGCADSGSMARITFISALWARRQQWRLEPWPLARFADCPTSYRLWFVAAHVLACAVAAALWRLTDLPLEPPDLWPGALVVAVTAVLSQVSLRQHEQAVFPLDMLVGLAFVLAGDPVMALACVALVPLVLALRKPIALHWVVGNCVNAIATIAVYAAIFEIVAGSAPFLSGQWLAGVVLAVVGGSALGLITLEVTFVLGGYATWDEIRGGLVHDSASLLVATLPQVIVVALALSQPSDWYLLAVILPYVVAWDVFRRSEQLVRSALSHRQLRNTFAGYVPASVVDQIVDGDASVELGGEQRIVSVLFLDIRGFTAWSELHEPTIIVRELNGLLGVLADEVFRTSGTLDKFTGDGLMAFWGAPLDQPDHAERALAAAMGMLGALDTHNDGRDELAKFRLGVGIHTGPAVIGNIGHDLRHDYTAIGDTVNLAARLEAATKEVRSDLVISAATHGVLSDISRGAFGHPTQISVKGKREPVVAYPLSRGLASTSQDVSEAPIDLRFAQ